MTSSLTWRCGHERTAGNTYVDRKREYCRRCRNARRREMAAKYREGVLAAEQERTRQILSCLPETLGAASARNWREVVRTVERAFLLERGAVTQKCKLKPFVRARHTAFHILKKRGNSYPQIGRWTGFDHSTVLNGCRQFEHHATPEMREVAKRLTEARA